MIYLACPYSHDDEEVEEKRANLATRIAATLSKEGNVVYSPLTSSRPLEQKGGCPKTWDFWEPIDKSFIDICDTLAVVNAPGWETSTGVQDEIEYAKSRDMDIRHIDPILYGTQIIGVSGKKRSGKDHLASKFENFDQYAFAGNLKKAAKVIFGLIDDQIDGDLKSEKDEFWGFTPRKALQVLGTDALRQNFRNDIWVRSLERTLLRDLPSRAIVKDVRFPDEVKAVQSWGGIVVRIDASERLDSNDTHASETALDDYEGFDYVVDNNGTIGDFGDNIHDFMYECGAIQPFNALWQ